MTERTSLVPIGPGIWMELPVKIKKRDKQKRIEHFRSVANKEPKTFNPNKK